MIGNARLCVAILMAFSVSICGAARAPQKPAPKATTKPVSKAAAKPASKATPALNGKTETLACRLGTEDRHARIAVVLVGGKTDSFAYYSKWKPRTCSIYLQRQRDPYSKWLDKGNVTTVNLERGLFLIEHKPNEYRFVFRDIDRERYCGMEGAINGSLTIRKGSEHCELTGIMEEGVPLGQAFAQVQVEPPAPAGVGATASAAPPSKHAVHRRPSRETPHGVTTVVIGD